MDTEKFVVEYNILAKEREKQGVPPLALNVAQTEAVIHILQYGSDKDRVFCKELLINRVSPGVDDSAKLKAEFLEKIIHGVIQCSMISPIEAIKILGTMLGGYNIPCLIDSLKSSNQEIAKEAANALKHTLLIYDAFENIAELSKTNSFAKEVIETSRKKGFHLNLYNDDVLIVEDDNKKFMEDYTKGRHTTYKVVNSFDEVKLNVVSKLLAIVYDEDELLKLQEEMKEQFKGRLTIVRSHKYYLEFTDPKATKGEALKFLSNYWGIKKEEIMASGDQDNDLDMLQNAGIKIAMGNASPKLKEIADFICPTINEDGLSFAIEKYITGEIKCV